MQEEYRTDEQLEALLSQCQIIEPELHCDQEKKIRSMCINHECQKHSLICLQQDCQKCGDKNHSRCIYIKFKGLTQIISDRAHKQKDFITEVCKIQNRFIDQIHNSRRALTKKYYLGDLQEKYLKIVEEIYKNKNTKCLTGKLAKEFYERLIKFNSNANQNAALLLENYKNSIGKLIEEMLLLKNRLYECFVKVTKLSVPEINNFDSRILRQPFSVDLSEFKSYDSLIVKHSKSLVSELVKEQKQFLMTALTNPKKLQLLYRASENAFSAAAFHQRCDNIPNTLTIVRTEFGKTIAGFTQYTWNAVSKNYLSEAGKKAFLLSLDLKQKMVPNSQSNLVYCHNSYGPTFGSGHDLRIYDQCHNNTNSGANFPDGYNYEGTSKYTNNQDSYRAFSGATNGSAFRVVEYEVFRVVY